MSNAVGRRWLADCSNGEPKTWADRKVSSRANTLARWWWCIEQFGAQFLIHSGRLGLLCKSLGNSNEAHRPNLGDQSKPLRTFLVHFESLISIWDSQCASAGTEVLAARRCGRLREVEKIGETGRQLDCRIAGTTKFEDKTPKSNGFTFIFTT